MNGCSVMFSDVSRPFGWLGPLKLILIEAPPNATSQSAGLATKVSKIHSYVPPLAPVPTAVMLLVVAHSNPEPAPYAPDLFFLEA